MRVHRQLKVQFEKGNSRDETLLGKSYYVVPVVAMVEGVRFGANQTTPELGLASEFGDVPIAWANRPLVLNHPKVDDEFVSANSPEVLEAYSFGLTMNPVLQGKKLHMEAWIDVGRVEELGGEFSDTLDRIKAEEDVEVSVGFYSDIEKKKGRFNGQAYGAIWRNVKPDHLAVLEEGILGACSVEDGCGIPRINQKDEDGNMAKLTTTATPDTTATKGAEPKVQCSCGGHDAPNVEAEDDEAPVTQGSFKKALGDILKTFTQSPFDRAEEARAEQREENRKILSQSINTTLLDGDVRKIISQAGGKKFPKYSYLYGYNNEVAVFETYDKDSNSYKMFQIGVNVEGGDVEFVGEPEEVILQTKVVLKDKVEKMKINEENDMADEPKTTATATPNTQTQTTEPKVQEGEPKKLSAQEYIEQAPAEVREVLQEQMRTHNEKREGLIKTLKDAKQNTFSEDELKGMNITTLEKMVGLLPPSYSGVAPANQPRFQSGDTGFVEAPKAFTVNRAVSEPAKTEAAA